MSPNDSTFEVAGTTTGIKTIFSVVYYDTEFTSLSWVDSVSDYFYSAVSHKMRVHDDNNDTLNTYNDGLEELKNVSYLGLFRPGWDPDNDSYYNIWSNLTQGHASDDLGLSGYWYLQGSGYPENLTNEANHGFDLLVGFTGVGYGAFGYTSSAHSNNLIILGINRDNHT
jgi:hypothetical protein